MVFPAGIYFNLNASWCFRPLFEGRKFRWSLGGRVMYRWFDLTMNWTRPQPAPLIPHLNPGQKHQFSCSKASINSHTGIKWLNNEEGMDELPLFVTHNYDGANECGRNRRKWSKINMFPCFEAWRKEGKSWRGLNGICYANVMTRLVAHNIRLPFFLLPTRGGRPKCGATKGPKTRSQKPPSGWWLTKLFDVGADCSARKNGFGPAGELCTYIWFRLNPSHTHTHAKLSQPKVNKSRPKQSERKNIVVTGVNFFPWTRSAAALVLYLFIYLCENVCRFLSAYELLTLYSRWVHFKYDFKNLKCSLNHY